VRAGRKAAPIVPRAFDAQKSSSKKLMSIKHLHEDDRFVTVLARRWAPAGAPVEFPTRAVAGFARD